MNSDEQVRYDLARDSSDTRGLGVIHAYRRLRLVEAQLAKANARIARVEALCDAMTLTGKSLSPVRHLLHQVALRVRAALADPPPTTPSDGATREDSTA